MTNLTDYSALIAEAKAVQAVSTERGDFPDTDLELITRLADALIAVQADLAKAVAAVGLPEGTSLEGLIKQHTVNARLAGVFDGIASEKNAVRAFQAPGGWFVFGSHLDFDGPLQFSVELTEDGLPRWERPLPLTANADTTVPATPHHSTEED